MGKIAFLFPGQGSQHVGMGKDFYEKFDIARRIYDEAETILDMPIKEVSFEGPEEKLVQTQYTQPAIFVLSIVLDRILRDWGIEPQATAGHSLGEYSALVCAGALDWKDALQLVKIRAYLMQHAGEKHPGSMAALLGASEEQVEEICRKAGEFGIVQPANFNAPGQVVISGDVQAIEKAIEIARDVGIRRVRQLPVGGAFHSPLMQDALNGLVEALDKVDIKPTRIPVYSNVEARPVSDPEHIRQLLKKQLLSPVQWVAIIQNMVRDGINSFYEVGPGKVLQGLQKRIVAEAPCRATGTVELIEKLKMEHLV